MKTIIKIDNLEILAKHGVFDFEKTNLQKFVINAVIDLDFIDAARFDDLELSISYADIMQDIYDFVTSNTFNLIETLSYRLALLLLNKYAPITKIKLSVSKPDAPVELNFGNVSTEVELSYHTAYLSLGSNLGNRELLIEDAINFLESDEIKVIKKSSLIETKPYGGVAKFDFINGAVQIKTVLSPSQLLVAINRIEANLKRRRDIRWGDRTIDIDIIFYDREIISLDNLNIPHIDYHNRDFVLLPLLEIAPNFVCPKFNKTIKEIFNDLNK